MPTLHSPLTPSIVQLARRLPRHGALFAGVLLAAVLLARPEAARAQGPAVAFEEVAGGFVHPVALAEAPDGSGRLFVVDQVGLIYTVEPDGTRHDHPFLDLRDRLVDLKEGYDERGLLGLAFHPDYATNGRFFVFYSAPLADDALRSFDHTNRLSAFTVSPNDPTRADPGSEQVLLAVDHPYTNHNAGQLAFGPPEGPEGRRYLYVSLGDGGHRDDQDTRFVPGHVQDWYDLNDGGNGQDIENNLLGSILRLDVEGGAGHGGHHGGGEPYGVPEDNPFTGIPGVLPEQWAYGFRNPWRFSFDAEWGLIAADVGQNLYGEISLVEKGGNYGWNVWEGAHCFSASSPLEPPADCPAATGEGHPVEGDPLRMPVVELRNAGAFADGEGLAVVGGYVVRGAALPALAGRYLFAEWSRGRSDDEQGPHHLPGRLYAATPSAEGPWPFEAVRVTNRPDGDPETFILALGRDADGDVYVLATDEHGVTGTSGRVFRLVAPDAER